MKSMAAAASRSTAAASRRPRRPSAAPGTGGVALPAPLRQGVEALSGLPMDAVRVHANSAEPARLGALAYAQGNDIHLGPGQQRHLAHEAWHVVQQRQGRVKATRQLRAAVPLNDNAALEHEADVMGRLALQQAAGSSAPAVHVAGLAAPVTGALAVVQRLSDKLASKYKKSDPDPAMLRDWQDETRLSDKELDALDALGKLVDAYNHLSADLVPKAGNKRVDAIVRLLDATADAKPEPVAPPSLRDRLMDALGMSTLYVDALLSGNRASDKALGAFLDSQAPDTEAILQCVASRQNTLRGVQQLLAAHGARYSPAQLLTWASSYGDAATAQAVADTSHETDIGYVTRWLSYGLSAASPTQLQQLVRFQALLAGGAQLGVQKADKRYQGSDAKRTGFLQYAFNDSRLRIHTHWARADMRLVSMHVQDLQGDNGLEMNQWTWFADVAAEVLAAHNRAVGPLRPSKSGSDETTVYAPLTL